MSVFGHIFGQDAAVGWLATAAGGDRLPHGLIFAGPAGVGKGTTAQAIATLFLCEKPNADQACGKCAACRGMAADAHPDYYVVHRRLIRLERKDNKATTLAADVVREYVNDKAHYKPMLNRGKVFVVEEAELMNPTAQNSLLKTLEEPPGRTLIILLTTNINQLLPTIRSRCQLVKFGPLPEKLVEAHLVKRGIPAVEAQHAARITEGSLGQSLRWLEDGVIAAALALGNRLDDLTPAGAVHLSALLKKFGDEYANAQEKRDKDVSRETATREALGIMMAVAASHLRRKFAASVDDAGRLDRLCAALELAFATERYVDANVTVSLAIEQFAINVSSVLAA